MDAVNYSELRRNLKSYLDQVHDDRETLIVTRKNNENVVLISLEEYNSFVETTYLLSSDANAKHIAESMRVAQVGDLTEHELIMATKRTPLEGIGKPEPLKHQLQGLWSRRINEEHRLVYEVEGDELHMISCRYHY